MTIALISDIHANLPAFEAMLRDLDTRKVDAVYCLGDLVGYNIWANEVISIIRQRGIATLAGNHDLKVRSLSTLFSSDLSASGKDYAYHIIGTENRSYLLTLPSLIRLEFNLSEQPLRILLAHGSPRSVNEYLLEDTNKEYLKEMMNDFSADVLCIGHSHKPFHRIIKREDGSSSHVINTGSVGKPKDNNPMGCYVLLTLREPVAINREIIGVEFVRFTYDIEKAARAILSSPLPDEFAQALKEAK